MLKHITKLRHKGFLLLFLCVGTIQLSAQNITFDTSEPDGVTVCGDTEIFYVEFTNISGGVLSNVNINVNLPDGINYDAGSVIEGQTSNVQEQDITDLTNVYFSSDDVAANETVSFTFEASADFTAYNSQNSGNTFSNVITVNYDGGSDNEATSTYNVLYAALSITNVSPMATTVFVGGSYTRTVTIVNGGYGSISEFILEDIHDANSTLDAVDIGTLNNEGSEITFTSSDFTSVGNGDGLFDQNESLTVTQTITVAGCSSFETELIADWGCGGETVGSNKKKPYTTVVLYAPDLSFTTTPSFNTCLGGADNQQISITNNGTGPANELEIVVNPTYGTQYTRTDISSIQLTTSTGASTLTPTATDAATNYDCLGSDPKDGFTVTIPPILPGETVVLDWDNYTCEATYCGLVRLIGWDYEANYTDMCSSKNYNNDDDGQDDQRKNMKTFFESPPDLVDAQEGTYSLILTTAAFSLAETSTSYFEVEFDVPLGLVWNGTGLDPDISYTSGGVEWSPSDIQFNTVTRKLTSRYPLPVPDGFNMVNSVFDLILSADCSEGVSMVTVGMQLYYIMDTDCSSIFRMPMTCYETAITQLHCPGNCEHGLAFQSFDVARTSMGISDNDQDGLPDDTNALDYSKVKTNRIMVSDTFTTVFKGDVITSATYPSWSYGYAQSSVPYGAYIDILSASVTIEDASTGQTLVCDNVVFADALSGDNRIVDFDFSPATLAAAGCTAFSGFVLEDEDEVTLTAVYKMVNNPGGITEQVTISNDFYVTNTVNGSGFQCNDWNGNFTAIGYYFQQNVSEQYNVKTCTKTIKQKYYMSIGVCCSNYNGGNIFPYEYRNWGNVKNMRVEIPEGYSFVSGQVEQWRTRYTNKSTKETVQITPTSIDGIQHYFDLESYHVQNGGGLNHSDDGFRGTVSIDVKPECTVNEAANFPMSWYFTFQENAALGGTETAEYTSTSDYLKYFRGDVEITTPLPTQEATGPTASWDIKVKSTNADTENTWFYLDYITNDITITEVKNIDTDVVVTPVNGFYQLGDISINGTSNYSITADYNSCNTSDIKVISGYDCDGYPNAINDYACSSEELMLYIIPQEAELQIKFNSETVQANECGNIFSVELEMLSAKLSNVEDLFVDIIQPGTGTIDIVSGTVAALYPIGGSYTTLTDPVANSGTYTITGTDMDAVLETDGLVGITDVSANIVKLKFDLELSNDFKSGDFLKIDVGGNRPCGTALPTLSLLVDPNAKFASTTAIGLDDAGDSWGMAWGDYDNDGYVDLFVTDNREDQANRLYHNDGDGTFTKITSGAIATDAATSLGATWGDYDNDGYLDLFVSNNIGFTNFLYRNNGNGSFTKILNDPIVNYNGYSHGVAWADYDNDGYLDMFVVDYFSTRFNHLYHNNGDGTFSDESSALPSLETGSSVSCTWADYNNDGMIDLFVTNINSENNSLYRNTGNGNFEKITTGDVVNDGGNSVGASWGDYDNDGDLDLFVSNAGQNNFLYQNNGDESFTKITSGDIVNSEGNSHGSAWGDYDNDGDLDLFVSNDSDSHNFLYANNGDGTFTTLTNGITEAQASSFGAAWADIDNDKDIDLFVANRDLQDDGVFVNSRGRCQAKACILLVGSNSNSTAIGAKVRIKANIYGVDVWQMREISSQTGGGIGGQSDMRSIFGLGDAATIDSVVIEWPSGYTQIVTGMNIDECYTITEDEGGQICGVAYYDKNENCVQDVDEPGIANLDILIQPGDIMVTTNDTGAYSVYLNPDTYTVSPVNNDIWTQDCTLSHSVDVLEMGTSYCGFDFAYTPVAASYCLSVEVTNTPHRIGFENLVALTYCNNGTETATNVQLQLTADANVSFVESSLAWDTYDGTTAGWNIGSLDIGECETIFVKDSVPSATELNTMITFDASITSDELTGVCPDTIAQTVGPAIGGFDPNDILVSPEGYIDNDQELIYTIRFQNVGNASVTMARVVDQLPPELDASTLQMGTASHAYRLDIEDENVLVWTFENINLIDSTTNETESNGYITFKIRPKRNLTDGMTIENDAAIFFDNNEPILTNVVVNTIGEEPDLDLADGSSADEGVLQIYPNPTSRSSTIQIFNKDGDNIKITGFVVRDMMGRSLIKQKGLDTGAIVFEKGNYIPGYYIIRVEGEDQKIYISKLMVY